jgi:hypothetical protein
MIPLYANSTKMLDTINFETIRDELLKENHNGINFPKKIDFEFPDNYKMLVTKIKTTEISAECILFNSVHAVNESNEFSKLDYWGEGTEIATTKEYWFFGANGQGDLWMMHKTNRIFFYDHNQGEISERNLTDLGLSFEKWLQFACLNKQFEDIGYEKEITNELKNRYKSKLLELSAELENNYPFEI